MQPILNRFLPHLVSGVVLLMAALMYLSPISFEGKSFPEGDNAKARGMQAEWTKYHKETGEHILWTQSAFSGMPTYQMQPYTSGNLLGYWGKVTTLFHSVMNPQYMLFLLMLSFYLAMLILKVDWKMALAGAMTYGLLTYHLLLLEAGHSTKVYAMSFVAPVLASALSAYRGRLISGGLTFFFFMAGQFYSNHMQISYYTLMLLTILGIVEFAFAVKEGRLKNFAMTSVVLALGAGVGFLSNTAQIWSTYEYANETIRGKSELTQNKSNKEGLDDTYVFEYSPSKAESFTLLVPGFAGSSSRESFLNDDKSKSLAVAQNLVQANKISKENQQDVMQATGHYWGGKPFTTGPVYYGAVICLLFAMGMVLLQGPTRWWAGASLAFFLMLSWGQYFESFNMFMFNHFPMYNKFRDVSTTLNVLEAMFYIVAIMGFWEFFKPERTQAERINALKIAAGVTGGICTLLYMWTFVGTAEAPSDQTLKDLGLPELARALQEDRMGLIRPDILRSMGFIFVAAAAMYAFATQKLSTLIAIISVGSFAVIDMVLVDARFINKESFVDKKKATAPPQATAADKMVMADKDPHFRVFDLLRGNPLASSEGGFFHKNIGGYHAAKLRRFQELADKYILDKEKGRFIFPENMNVLGMLNAKYVLQSPELPSRNPYALGNAWFVDSLKVVANADEELAGLKGTDLRKFMVVQTANQPKTSGDIRPDSLDYIKLTSYHPEKLTYEYNAKGQRVAVFSEMYYPPAKGWNTYIDGQLIPEGFGKANFLLRYLTLPVGKHTVEMRFEPTSIHTGRIITMICSLLAWAALFFAIYRWVKSPEEVQAA